VVRNAGNDDAREAGHPASAKVVWGLLQLSP
jgi:hypothetical protein